MSDKKFLHHHPEFKELIRIVAGQLEIDPYLAEKDYWIMHCLFGLQQAGYDFQLKGGTSLSKGYKIIHRFSEDIDIHIMPPEELDLKTGKNHTKAKHIEARKAYYDSLAEEISIPDIKASRDAAFDDEYRYRSGGVRLAYETHFEIGGTAAKEGVLLELGFDDIAPNAPIDISSWAYDYANSAGVDVVDNRAKGVPCYEPGYTFVEKLQTITTKFRNYKAGSAFPENFMRHYYDVYCLLQDKKVQDFIGSDDFFVHKKKRFPGVDFVIPMTDNQAFLLSDPEDFKVFKKEYEGKEALYYSGQPDFEDVIGEIRQSLDKW
ncbi:MAG: hypothetical protein COB46_14265 [Rhodospirillaceae bacterium]|nr:MAG: hypothetical protein COB46_14265 [Rhodospirillaceae bacterium]